MKRFYLFSSEFPPEPGGIGNHAYNLASFFSNEKFQIKVITRTNSTHLQEARMFDSGLSFTTQRYVQQGGCLLFRLVRILRVVDERVVIIASGRIMLIAVGIGSLLWPAVRRCTKLVVVHGTDIQPQHRWLRWLVHRLLHRFNRIISVSNYTALRVPDSVKSRVKIINNGFNVELFPSPKMGRSMRSRGLSLVTVGSVTERKGQINVIRALPLLRRKFGAVTYHMVGLPAIGEIVFKEALRLGVEREVHMHGVLQHQELLAILNRSDIFIMLSENTPGGSIEGFGIAVIEANALGLPAIGSQGTGLEDSIKHGYSGLLVDPHVPESICDAVETICSCYEEFSINAIHHARQFTWDQVGRRYLREIECLA